MLILALNACSPAPPGGGSQSNPCEFGSAAFDVGPVAFCEQAVAVAQARLGWLHWPVTSIRFLSSLCPPNARCGFVLGPESEGWVAFAFSLGEPSMVHVTGNAGGVLLAGDPEPWPAWLLDEVRNEDQSPPGAPQPVGG